MRPFQMFEDFRMEEYWILRILKKLWYHFLAGVRSLISTLMIFMGFFVEKFLVQLYVKDDTTAQSLIMIINKVVNLKGWIFLILMISFWIIYYRELKYSEVNNGHR